MGGVQSVVTGRLTWHGTTIACRECQEYERWTMTVEQPGDVAGELAWLDCAAGHRVRHPLVYPSIVRTVLAWSDEPGLHESPARQSLWHLPWLPHWISWKTGGTLRAPRRPEPVYRPWTERGPVAWDRAWPELVAAYAITDHIAAWSTSAYSDYTVMLSLGGTDPDVCHIELPESDYRIGDHHPVRLGSAA